jgi:threonine synthase
MDIICDNCDYSFKRIDAATGDSYKNIYGTRCPKCNHLIKTEYEKVRKEKIDNHLKEMREEMLSKIRNKELE